MIHPFDKVNNLSITLSRILEVSKAWRIEKVTELNFLFVAGMDVSFYEAPVHLRQDKTRSGSSDDVKRKFAEKGIYRCPL
jgi:hypothetical protein